MPPTDTLDGLRRRGRFIDGATFGAFLRNHREGRNLTLHDIAAGTKIATRHLAALERGDVRSWPGGLYRRAMVRAYAAAVGLDPDVTVSEFTDAFAEVPVAVEPEPKQLPAVPLQELLGSGPRASVVLGLAACATIAVLGWTVTSSDAAGAMKTSAEPAAPAIAGSASPGHADSAAAPAPVEPAVQNASNVDPARNVEGSLRIASEPAGADVTVNGIRWGQTPVTIQHLEPGQKRVRVSMNGYTSAERRLELTADRPAQAVRVVLDAAP
jgi:cytoskeleton protein RodZ